tara:strand:- start:1669 stop:2028 length:360 start_codon:yes stop_codon:yes gene_type:complete
MNFIKLLGVSALVLGLAACAEKSTDIAALEVDAPEEMNDNISKFNTEKFGSSSDPSTAPAPAFAISKNLQPGEYVNEKGEVMKNRELEGVVENPLLRAIPEGIEEGSVEHTMWLLSQEE